jgi:hypothetical protein
MTQDLLEVNRQVDLEVEVLVESIHMEVQTQMELLHIPV